MPAIALVLSLDSVAPSVAAAAVALLVAFLDALLVDVDVLVAVLLDVTIEDDVVPETALEISLNDTADVSALPKLLEGVEIVSVVEDRSLDIGEEESDVANDAAELVCEATGTSLLVALGRDSDIVDMTGILVVVGKELSELENRVVMALMVAVMVPAIFGMAPWIPSQTV